MDINHWYTLFIMLSFAVDGNAMICNKGTVNECVCLLNCHELNSSRQRCTNMIKDYFLKTINLIGFKMNSSKTDEKFIRHRIGDFLRKNFNDNNTKLQIRPEMVVILDLFELNNNIQLNFVVKKSKNITPLTQNGILDSNIVLEVFRTKLIKYRKLLGPMINTRILMPDFIQTSLPPCRKFGKKQEKLKKNDTLINKKYLALLFLVMFGITIFVNLLTLINCF